MADCDLGTISEDFELDCNDKTVGSIVSLYYAKKDDVTLTVGAEGSTDEGLITALTAAPDTIFKLEFNNRDGFTSFDEGKTADPTGLTLASPNVRVQFPRMELQKRNTLENITAANYEYLVFIEAASGEHHVFGNDFGMRADEVNGTSGTGRQELNTFDLVFTGEEKDLSLYVENMTVWDEVINNRT